MSRTRVLLLATALTSIASCMSELTARTAAGAQLVAWKRPSMHGKGTVADVGEEAYRTTSGVMLLAALAGTTFSFALVVLLPSEGCTVNVLSPSKDTSSAGSRPLLELSTLLPSSTYGLIFTSSSTVNVIV